MRRLQHDTGMATLFITHDLAVVADRVLVMYAGRAAEEAGVEALLDRPLSFPGPEDVLEPQPRARDRCPAAQVNQPGQVLASERCLRHGRVL